MICHGQYSSINTVVAALALQPPYCSASEFHTALGCIARQRRLFLVGYQAAGARGAAGHGRAGHRHAGNERVSSVCDFKRFYFFLIACAFR